MNASVIAIGDELLIGQVIDTNSGDIARMLNPVGWKMTDVQVVADDAGAITRAIDRAFATSDVVLTTGGLGPTKDDITKETLRQYFGGDMREDADTFQNVREVVTKRGLKLNDLTARQAIVPSSCRVIQNLVGTAPIMWFEKGGKVLVAMPGVPFETRQMFSSAVLPALLEKFPSDIAVEHRTLLVVNWSESRLAAEIAEWEDALPACVHLAYLPKPGLIRLRLDGMHRDRQYISRTLDALRGELIERLGDDILFADDKTPEEILLHYLHKKNLTVATAESCTGGSIARLITSVAGSSASFLGSVVAYSNEVKHNLLRVGSDTLAQYGAVSLPVVEQMAEGAAQAIGSDCAIATSGIAGPGGGTPEKPVGTVCIAVKSPLGVVSAVHHFPGTRDRVIDRSATTAIIALIQQLKKL